MAELVIVHEHPAWQDPLFAALTKRGICFRVVNTREAAFDPATPLSPAPLLVFNQASPSAYTRPGAARAVPLTLALLTSFEACGARVLNGPRAFALELSKTAQAALLRRLGISAPRSLAFNDVEAALRIWGDGPGAWPAILKPEQGGSGARMFLLHSPEELTRLLRAQPELWQPDGLLLLQEYLRPRHPERGIVRLELLGGELLYAMRVVAHGAFNLCPSVHCNPSGDDNAGLCAPPAKAAKPVEFYAYPEVPPEAVAAARRISAAGGLDVCGIEYMETDDNRLCFFDVNANSNLRTAVGEAYGIGDPFERVVDFLKKELQRAAVTARGENNNA